ncbi:class I SAM-dependent methyltransferase [Aliiglaciecola sp. CAU 1673]|uniref:class I SAM-dependent methyltransferase n=1 Tax=Aliiglaciecola sp. CAU 1673 TaxID=3032595 RepID=UPI0023DC6433|nr:class I SAM-dependent methyltransferase [Aliiglaciecola sp. CAU 1673]MDF2180137.1 class I SAM-dependent methyltransferase [Aliiglaciecola sp. CAU 1673]
MKDSFYQIHATQFFQDTQSVDMQPLYQRFLPLLAPGAHILDAGCGSGRDAKYFSEQGFVVSAFDASPALVGMAREFTGLDIELSTFDAYQAKQPLDAIWACASLLHVPVAKLAQTFNHLASQLSQNGLFYCSFKYGEGEVQRGNRLFTDLTEHGLAQVLASTPLEICDRWKTADLRQGREQEPWLNAILRKRA